MSPDRKQPGSAWFVTAYLMAVCVGVVGIVAEPSVSVRATLESTGLGWAIPVWSLGYLFAGAASAIARLRRWYCAEVWAVYALGGLFWLWAAMVAVAGNGSSWQAGLGFLSAGAFMFGWAGYRRFRLRRNASTSADLRRAVNATVGEGIRQGSVMRDAEPEQ